MHPLQPTPRPFRRLGFAIATACLAAVLTRAVGAPGGRDASAGSTESQTSAAQGDPVGKSVVKIFVTARPPDHAKPWSRLAPTSLAGSGVVIEGRRILCNAHLVLYASQVQVQANEAGDKVSATVAGISPEMDLAVLNLEDESFFESHSPLPRARGLPRSAAAVMVYGFPTGGFSMSITKGIVSRIEFAPYNYGATGLRVQVDAAINPGNSGGPAMTDGEMVGIAFAYLSKSDNISYVIPCEEIDLFLKHLVKGSYHGRPVVRARSQALQNAALRSFLKVGKDVHGLVVQAVDRFPEGNPLKQWDIITRIGEAELDDEGMIRTEGGTRVAYNYLAESLAVDGHVPLTVLRAGKKLQLQVPVASNPDRVLPFLKGSFPSYFVYGPLVFSEGTADLVADCMFGRRAALWMSRMLGQGNPMLRRIDDSPESPGERLVVVTSFLPHRLSRGYEDPTGQVVKTVNGIPIKNLSQLVQILRDCSEPFVTVEFDGQPLFTDTLVFSRAETMAATEEILSDNSIRTQGSTDMIAVWNGKK